MPTTINSNQWTDNGSVPVDIQDILYHYEENTFSPEINADYKTGLIKNQNEAKTNSFIADIRKPFSGIKRQIISGNDVPKNSSLWEKTIDWITENPGKTLLGAIVAGVGIAYFIRETIALKHGEKEDVNINQKQFSELIKMRTTLL
jgi:hypothetical protein